MNSTNLLLWACFEEHELGDATADNTFVLHYYVPEWNAYGTFWRGHYGLGALSSSGWANCACLEASDFRGAYPIWNKRSKLVASIGKIEEKLREAL